MKDKVWELEYEGRRIRVINRISIFPPRTSEVLEVDGAIVKENKGSFQRTYALVEADVEFAGVAKRVEALIGQRVGTLSTGCHIRIDGELVGGDIGDRLNLPDRASARKQFEQGAARYIAKTGLLLQGLPFAIIMTFLNPQPNVPVAVVTFVLHFLLFGTVMGWFMWRNLKSQVEQYEKQRRNDCDSD